MKTSMFYGASPMLFELTRKLNDQIRQKDLEDLGLTVLRFTTTDISNNPN